MHQHSINLTRKVFHAHFDPSTISANWVYRIIEKAVHMEENLDDDEIELKIGYQLSIFSIVQLQLPKSRREPAARYVELSNSMPWDDLKDQLKIRVSDVLFPQQANVPNEAIELAASVARYLPDAVPLVSEADYKMIKRHAMKMKDPVVKVLVKQKLPAAVVRPHLSPHAVTYHCANPFFTPAKQ